MVPMLRPVENAIVKVKIIIPPDDNTGFDGIRSSHILQTSGFHKLLLHICSCYILQTSRCIIYLLFLHITNDYPAIPEAYSVP
jgi:hypothetical protein